MVRIVLLPGCDFLQVLSLFFLGVVIVKGGGRRKGVFVVTNIAGTRVAMLAPLQTGIDPAMPAPPSRSSYVNPATFHHEEFQE